MIGKKQTNMLEAASADEQQKVRKGFHVFVDIFLATVCGLTFGFTVSIFLFSMVSDNMQGMRDGGLYWATGQQLVRHANPYDVEVISRIERVLGHPLKYRGLMRNPPWALPIVYPFGFMGLRASSILWNFVLMGCLAISVHLFWIMQGRPGNSRLLLGYTFAPALICTGGKFHCLCLWGWFCFYVCIEPGPFSPDYPYGFACSSLTFFCPSE
jgi:hypothetical protein